MWGFFLVLACRIAFYSIFDPGFNPAYLVSQVPAIVEEVFTFTKILRDRYGQGQVFRLDPVTLNMTLDVISRLTLHVCLEKNTAMTHLLMRL